MQYLYIKSLHIIFITTWFAGLFYIIRLFIYYKEAEDKTEVEKNILLPQYKLMIKRLWYIITWPSAVLATLFAVWMLLMPIGKAYLTQPWMQIKLTFVVMLFAYHWSCQIMYNQIEKGNLTGAFLKYYENGQLQERISYSDGYEEGIREEYFEDGQLRFQINYKSGKIHGIITRYHENGQLAEETSYFYGVKHGPNTFYDKSGKSIDTYYWYADEVID